ncbi:RNA-binding protein lark-like [Sinocyclocheilus grahami]|uniref:RNA-binding protein 14 n=1 Tax=Sinocyclocheilus grahami TaxID=75366 RepID=A0A672L7Y0_SINGR|nr:PREDICTED: RNA-binding protein lark-like [Sinocyclocheilus grahami]
MVKIFVGNVASATTEDELRALFEKYGAVSDCDILKNYGFVHMDEEEAAQKAVSALHKHEVNGSRITVEYATTKVRNATKIYVGNVPDGVTAAKIKELFQPFGKVVECDIVKNYAFVHMQRESEALEAISKLNHSKLEGQKVFVSLSRSNPSRNDREEDYFPPPPHHYPPHPHHHPHFVPPRPPPREYYPPRGRLPPPPLPPPPPRAYYEHDVYERSLRHDPYADPSPRFYDRDPYDRRIPPPQRPVTPPLADRYYRERSPLGGRRSLLPPPPPPPSSAGFSRGFARNGASSAPPPPPAAPSSHYQRYSLGSGFDKDDYLEDKYSNGFSRSYY